jgi:hypothetical protein
MSQGRDRRDLVSGILSGMIGGALVGLMKIRRVLITSGKQIIQQRALDPGATTTLLPATTYRFAIILFHGDGDPQVQLTIQVNNKVYMLYGDEQAIELIANESITITATNTDTTSPRSTPTIELVHLTW